jgi:hypothetical protein
MIYNLNSKITKNLINSPCHSTLSKSHPPSPIKYHPHSNYSNYSNEINTSLMTALKDYYHSPPIIYPKSKKPSSEILDAHSPLPNSFFNSHQNKSSPKSPP